MIKIEEGGVIRGNISMSRGGNGYLTSEKLPKDIYIYKGNMNQALHLDDVDVRVFKSKDGKLEGEVIRITNRFKDEFVGTLQVSNKFAFLVPDSIKMPHDLFIPMNKLLDGKDGQKAIAKITKWKKGYDNPNGEIIEVLGDAGDNDAEMNSILFECGLERDFPQDVLDEAEAINGEITQEEINKRWDFRGVTTCTIDGADARDLDDALSFKVLDNGDYEVGVHIADIPFYCRPNSDLNTEAFKRSTSIYLVGSVIPMFPERLSNDICSLNPNTDKLVYSYIFTFNGENKLINERFGRGIINSNHRLTYDDVQSVIEGGETHSKELKSVLLHLDRMAKDMRSVRMVDSLDFSRSETKFILDNNGKPIDVKIVKSLDSNRLIEEFMVLTNRRVCEFIVKKGLIAIHRSHPEPDEERLIELRNLVVGLGYELNIAPKDLKKSLRKLLVSIKGTVHEEMISTLIVRSQQKAFYSTDNIGHWGMGLGYYSHTTSPIRRFADILTMRQLDLALGDNGYPRK